MLSSNESSETNDPKKPHDMFAQSPLRRSDILSGVGFCTFVLAWQAIKSALKFSTPLSIAKKNLLSIKISFKWFPSDLDGL